MKLLLKFLCFAVGVEMNLCSQASFVQMCMKREKYEQQLRKIS
jgi:hypothetical protein